MLFSSFYGILNLNFIHNYRAFKILGTFVLTFYLILKRDISRFFLIWGVFLFSFSQGNLKKFIFKNNKIFKKKYIFLTAFYLIFEAYDINSSSSSSSHSSSDNHTSLMTILNSASSSSSPLPCVFTKSGGLRVN